VGVRHHTALLDTPVDAANMFRMNRRPRRCSQGRIFIGNRGQGVSDEHDSKRFLDGYRDDDDGRSRSITTLC
jgi:hypothetical protein